MSGESSLETPTIDISSKEFYGEGYDDSDKRIPDMTIINKQLGMHVFSHVLNNLYILLVLRIFWHFELLFDQLGTRKPPYGTCLNQHSPTNTGHMLRLSSRPCQSQLQIEGRWSSCSYTFNFFLPLTLWKSIIADGCKHHVSYFVSRDISH